MKHILKNIRFSEVIALILIILLFSINIEAKELIDLTLSQAQK